MASYPIKMMKDENNKPFVPLVSTEGIKNPQGQTLDSLLNTKIGPSNLHGGDNISITTSGYDCFINLDLPSSLNVIDNLTTPVSGQGALDAHQGKILKDSIPIVDNDISSTSTTHALSAYQGYVLNNKFNNYTTTTDMNNKFNSYLPLTGGTISNTLSVNGNTSLNSNVAIGGELKVEGNIHASNYYQNNYQCFGVKAWAYATISGTTPTIVASGNISKVERTGTGAYRFTFSKAMPDRNFAAVVSCETNNIGQEIVGVYAHSTTGVYVDIANHEGTAVDPTEINLIVVR